MLEPRLGPPCGCQSFPSPRGRPSGNLKKTAGKSPRCSTFNKLDDFFTISSSLHKLAAEARQQPGPGILKWPDGSQRSAQYWTSGSDAEDAGGRVIQFLLLKIFTSIWGWKREQRVYRHRWAGVAVKRSSCTQTQTRYRRRSAPY